MQLTSEIMRDFLQPRLNEHMENVKVGIGKIPDMPNRAVLVTRAGQGKELYNGLYEKNLWRFFCRGASNNPQDAEEIGLAVVKSLDGIENYDLPENDIRIMLSAQNGVVRQLTITDSQSRFQSVAEMNVISSKD